MPAAPTKSPHGFWQTSGYEETLSNAVARGLSRLEILKIVGQQKDYTENVLDFTPQEIAKVVELGKHFTDSAICARIAGLPEEIKHAGRQKQQLRGIHLKGAAAQRFNQKQAEMRAENAGMKAADTPPAHTDVKISAQPTHTSTLADIQSRRTFLRVIESAPELATGELRTLSRPAAVVRPSPANSLARQMEEERSQKMEATLTRLGYAGISHISVSASPAQLPKGNHTEQLIHQFDAFGFRSVGDLHMFWHDEMACLGEITRSPGRAIAARLWVQMVGIEGKQPKVAYGIDDIARKYSVRRGPMKGEEVTVLGLNIPLASNGLEVRLVNVANILARGRSLVLRQWPVAPKLGAGNSLIFPSDTDTGFSPPPLRPLLAQGNCAQLDPRAPVDL